MLTRGLLLLVFAYLTLPVSVGAQPATGPAAELVQYIRDARKAGLKDAQIQKNAVEAGWDLHAIQEAIAYLRSNSETSHSKTKATASEIQPAKTAPANFAGPSGGSAPPKSLSAEARPASEHASPVNTTDASGRMPAKTPGPTAGTLDTGNTKPAIIDRGVSDDYRIGEGDVIQVSVWGEPTASVNSVVVRPDGRITLPLIKDIAIAGMTPAEVEKVVTQRLAADIKSPDVTVIVSQINSKKVFIVGGAKKEGPLAYTYRMTVMQAISEAGGLTDYAKRKKIYVLRNENGRQYQLPFDYDAVLKGQRMELNYTLEPGDTLVIPH